MTNLHLMIITPFLFALVVPFLFRFARRVHTGWFVLLVPLWLFAQFLAYLGTDLAAEPVRGTVPWIPVLGIDFSVHLDGLALLFALIISGIGVLVVLYSIYYMDREREALSNFYIYILLFMGAMLGLVLSDNLAVLYAFWEGTSVASFLLIGYWFQRKHARYGAHKSLLITVFGGFAMLLGFVFLYTIAGTFSLRALLGMSDQIASHPLFSPAMLLILLGAFTKSAQFPFHVWLPDAMEAPTPISAYLHSATMVKAGVYLAARLTPLFGSRSEWSWILIAVGLITLFWGSFIAVRRYDLKVMLAYSTVSQLGMIMALIGAGAMALHAAPGGELALVLAGGTLAALFHLVNHSIFKGSLFMIVGILDHETGTRDVRRLSGLRRVMPVSFVITLIAAFSMAGLPPLSGFLSKEMFFTGMLNASRVLDVAWAGLLPLIAWVASTFTFIYCLVLAIGPFTGPFRQDMLEKSPRRTPVGMLLAPAVLAVFVVLFFFSAGPLAEALLEPAMHAVVPGLLAPGERFPVHIQAWHGWNTELFMTLGIIAVGSLLYVQRPRWFPLYDFLPGRVSVNYLYDQGRALAEKAASRVTRQYMTGLLPHYLSYLFIVLTALVGGAFLVLRAFALDTTGNAGVTAYEVILGIAVVAAAATIVATRSRLVAILALSAVGLAISLFYVIFRAPDLALTQLVVETISTALFLLCFYFLPRTKTPVPPLGLRTVNALIALGVGTTLTLVGLAAQGYQVFPSIAPFYEDSRALAGALNMVNALLVDFRGFDTMFEIVVLFTAGLGVFALIKLRLSGGSGP